ncbi:hypothetical protein CU048_10860 [Beijerinckiaceae bacterium]|nr:hypothetical protein CU048_10860 [Beijerinckiaceae bacterium]
MQTLQSVRVVILNDGGQWIAQCLEHDICAMANNLDTLQSRLEVAIEAELELCKSEGRDLSSLPQAPAHFFTLWDKRSNFDKSEMIDGVGYQMALCA